MIGQVGKVQAQGLSGSLEMTSEPKWTGGGGCPKRGGYSGGGLSCSQRSAVKLSVSFTCNDDECNTKNLKPPSCCTQTEKAKVETVHGIAASNAGVRKRGTALATSGISCKSRKVVQVEVHEARWWGAAQKHEH